MDAVMQAAVQQVPALAVLSLLVMVFIRAIEKVSADFASYLEKRDEVLAQLGAECHVVQERATDAIRENAVVMGRTVHALEGVERVIQRSDERRR